MGMFRLLVGVTVVLLIVESLAQLALPYVLGRMVARLSPPVQIMTVPLWLVASYGGLMLLRSLASNLEEVAYQPLSQRLQKLVAQEGLRHVHGLSLRFHLERQTGALTRVLDRGSDAVDTLLRLTIFNIGPAIMNVTLTLGVVGGAFGLEYALLIGFGLAAYVLMARWFVRKRVVARRARNDASSASQHRLIDSLLNFEAVRHFGNQSHEYARFGEARRALEKANLRVTHVTAASSITQNVMIALVTSAIFYLAMRDVLAHRIGVPQFVMIGTYLRSLYMAVVSLNQVYSGWRNARVDLEKWLELLAQDSEIAVPEAPVPVPTTFAEGGAASLVFDDVSFGYNAQRRILDHVSFAAAPGQRIGIVGPTGSGKSTIGKLLFRSYDPDSGAILFDGWPLPELDPQDLRAAIGIVPQDTLLFNDTIAYNIAYGSIGASPSAIEEAARAAELHDFIHALPDGYETQVGERGLRLSGGEKQRLAIARVILKNPRILLLDEATSALDTRTERRIQSALDALSRARTTITIAHRLSTVVECDEILLIEKGRVAERGTHTELMRLGGDYAAMWRAQSRELLHSAF